MVQNIIYTGLCTLTALTMADMDIFKRENDQLRSENVQLRKECEWPNKVGKGLMVIITFNSRSASVGITVELYSFTFSNF